MNKIIALVAIVVLWFAYQNRSGQEIQEYVDYEEVTINEPAQEIETKYTKKVPLKPVKKISVKPTKRYKCDGRQYCSQMTSCAEATYFLRHCPNTKMDGKGRGNGIPCERQWCH